MLTPSWHSFPLVEASHYKTLWFTRICPMVNTAVTLQGNRSFQEFHCFCCKVWLDFVKFELDGPLKWVAGRAEELRFKESFDTVIMLNVLEHTQNAYKVINSIYNSLKPNGRFFCFLYWLTCLDNIAHSFRSLYHIRASTQHDASEQ